MKGYHYTSYDNWENIQEKGLVPELIINEDVQKESSETVGSWMFQNRQQGAALFGMLMDRFAAQNQLWEYAELEIDFVTADCLKALDAEDTLIFKHLGACGSWVYHKGEPIIVVSKLIPACQITLLRVFDLQRAIHDITEVRYIT